MKINNKIKKEFEKEGYRLVGAHSAIKICRWTRKSLRNEGFCYKQQFYGVNSHRCVQMSCTLFNCQNKCIHCWRNLNYTCPEEVKNPDSPKEIIKGCIKEQQKILQGFGGNKKVSKKKFCEAIEPTQFAISLTGEGTLYPKLAELIKELRKQKKTSFLVTNGLMPEKLLELEKENALPTQLYISINTPNEEMYKRWHRGAMKNAWQKFNKSLDVLKKLKGKTRTVLRLTLVKDLNMIEPENYTKLINKAMPDFVEVKSYMSVGFARQRLGYDRMPSHSEIKAFAERLSVLTAIPILDEKADSRVVLLGKDKAKQKIKRSEL